MKILGIDLETTGLKENDRIIEYCGIMLDSGKVSDITMRFNPQMPIDPAAAAVHHIQNEDLFDDIADALHDRQGIVIMNVQQGMSAEEFVRQNKGRLEIMGLI